MKTQILKSILLLIALYSLQSFDTAQWFKAGNKPNSYIMETDINMQRNNHKVNTIKAKEEAIEGFGTYMSTMKVGEYGGKRVRMSGYMKSSNVNDWAGFWMRIDGSDRKETGGSLAFDNMQNRAVKGSTDWKKYEIVLDVPTVAYEIAFGALISGSGQIWFDEVKFELVDKTVETTGID